MYDSGSYFFVLVPRERLWCQNKPIISWAAFHQTNVVNGHISFPNYLVSQFSASLFCILGLCGCTIKKNELLLILQIFLRTHFLFLNLLCKANKIFVIGIHVSQFAVNEHQNLVFASLFFFSDIGGNDSFSFFSKSWIAIHLKFIETKMHTRLFNEMYLT